MMTIEHTQANELKHFPPEEKIAKHKIMNQSLYGVLKKKESKNGSQKG